MRHLRPSWWRRQTDKHPLLADLLPVLGIIACLFVAVALLFWVGRW